jgi:signal transduction histidine kinase
MRSLYLRIYLTVVAVLALFALVSGWVVQQHLDEQRVLAEAGARERLEAWSELLQRSLPPADAPPDVQAAALSDWSQRLRVPMALDDATGQRIGATDSFLRRQAERPDTAARLRSMTLDDGRVLWVARPWAPRGSPGSRTPEPHPPWLLPRGWSDGLGLALLLVVLFLAVAAGAWPVVRGLTRRLEALKQGVEAFGAGALHQRVAEAGRDEVAALGASFNRAAARIEALLHSHQTLLANASHELRSPLARLKMALAMLDGAAPAQQAALKQEIQTNIAELDALVEEVLLTSRLDAAPALEVREPVALLALAVEEAARLGAVARGQDLLVPGDERLLRRAVRNLLENARRYGGSEVEISVAARSVAEAGQRLVELRVCDRGPGVPEAFRERIFEAFVRLPGHAEREGGVGLGLSLVRQIAQRHGGSVRCEPRPGGGSCFVLDLPAV